METSRDEIEDAEAAATWRDQLHLIRINHVRAGTPTDFPTPMWVSVSPTMAHGMLMASMGANYRRMITTHRKNIAHAMVRGEFNSAQSDPIRIDDGGRVIDGQHRLSALVDARVTQTLLLVYPSHAYSTIDAHRVPRRFRDALAHVGYQDTSVLSGLTKWLANITSTNPRPVWVPSGPRVLPRLTDEQLMNVLRDNEALLLWGSEVYRKLGSGGIGAGATAATVACVMVAHHMKSVELPTQFVALVTAGSDDHNGVGRAFLSQLRHKAAPREIYKLTLRALQYVHLDLRVGAALRGTQSAADPAPPPVAEWFAEKTLRAMVRSAARSR